MDGKVALVTGGGSGMGRASAAAFAARGAHVVIADVDEAAANGTIDLMPDGTGTFVETDVTSADQVQRAIALCTAEFGSLDFVHNNAGVSGSNRPVHETTEADWVPDCRD